MSARVVPARLGSLTDPTQFCEPLDIDEMPKEDLLPFVRSMLLIRRVEETIADMVESGEAKCPCHLGIGQEAAAVGVASALRPTDRAFGAHRSHSHYVAMGGNVRQLLAEVLGKVTGCSRGFGGSMHLRDTSIGLMGTVPIVGATIPLAVGAALALKLSGGNDIAVSFLGDGATEEGVFHESLNLAKNLAVPVLFVVENNLYSSHLHIDLRQSVDRTARFAEAHNVRSVVIDGNDVVRVARTAQDLVDAMRARSGAGVHRGSHVPVARSRRSSRGSGRRGRAHRQPPCVASARSRPPAHRSAGCPRRHRFIRDRADRRSRSSGGCGRLVVRQGQRVPSR